LGILLLSGTHERAHYAFVVAAAAAALGRRVVVFASNAGCHALLADWSGLADAGRDAVISTRGVAGLDELRAACVELEVTLLVCEAGLRAENLHGAALFGPAQSSGVATLLAQTAGGQILTI